MKDSTSRKNKQFPFSKGLNSSLASTVEQETSVCGTSKNNEIGDMMRKASCFCIMKVFLGDDKDWSFYLE